MQPEQAAFGEKWEFRASDPGDPAGLKGQLSGLLRPELHLQLGDTALPAQPAGDARAQRIHAAHASRQQQLWVKQRPYL